MKKLTVKDFDERWIPEPNSGCHLWTSYSQKRGYGIFGRKTLAHRASWQFNFGKIPDGMLICHKCDNPSCVNPEHLFLGTYADNNHDRDKKGRRIPLKGENHGRSKLTADQVREIRSSSMSAWALSKRFGVNPKTISDIVSRKIWRSL